MENLSNMCICLHGLGARRPPYTHYSNYSPHTITVDRSNKKN